MTTKISYAIAFLTGLGMIFLGVRFFLSPEVATTGFGIHFNADGDYSFQHIKGIRDIPADEYVYIIESRFKFQANSCNFNYCSYSKI